MDFEEFVKERLEQAHREEELNISSEEVAWEMMKSRDFQNTKCEHGGPDDTPVFSVPVPGISLSYTNTAAGLENGEMQFTRLVVAYHLYFIVVRTLISYKGRNYRGYSTAKYKS